MLHFCTPWKRQKTEGNIGKMKCNIGRKWVKPTFAFHIDTVISFSLQFKWLVFKWNVTMISNGLTHSSLMHPFSTPWKHKKTVRFSDVFRGKRRSTLGTNWLMCLKFILNMFAWCAMNLETVFRNWVMTIHKITLIHSYHIFIKAFWEKPNVLGNITDFY